MIIRVLPPLASPVIVLTSEVDGFPDVFDGPLRVDGRDDFELTRGGLVGGEDADLSPSHLLLMNHHRLRQERAM